jgi:hypothetical protein
MAFHRFALTRFGPAIEFLLEPLVGSCRLVSQARSPLCNLVSFVFKGLKLSTTKDTKVHKGYATFGFLMASNPQPPTEHEPELLYCPKCALEVSDPLTCGDCSAVICRRCGTPLESADELGMG